MSTGMLALVTVVGLLVVSVLLYNRLVTLRNRNANAFSQIEVQLQRRYELIPNLVETASAFMKHESETLLAVTNARNIAADRCSEAARNPQDPTLLGALANAEKALGSAMGRFNMVMENYPDLKADAQMRDLHESLESTENRIAYARQAYSDAVMQYNTAREQFPTVIVASAFSFQQATLFEVEDEEMKRPIQVSFS